MRKKQQKYYFDIKIKIARVLFFVNALIWLGFSIFLFRDMTRLNSGTSAFVAAFFVLTIAGTMLASGIMIAKRIGWAYYFGLIVLALNIFLSFIGEFGVFTFISILVDIILLMILFSFQRPYFSKA